ncbi:sensor histidine kinase [Ferroacidibacillus organovorans]|uniref:histidine kinase n=1 Tax=Ferroacidibacillus organovorans TaxID=1765683 RepID=A0A101XR91_9BACL|nr:HAMP domain-containing sensor histidine kinase [Ferroacidibacillus organovorans]KUO96067.1 hypothetical protein ATW55_01475 [Ferroacidibacillus organovorans]
MFQTIRIRLTAMLVLLYLILYLVSSTVIYALTSQLSIGNLDAILKETADPLAAQISATLDHGYFPEQFVSLTKTAAMYPKVTALVLRDATGGILASTNPKITKGFSFVARGSVSYTSQFNSITDSYFRVYTIRLTTLYHQTSGYLQIALDMNSIQAALSALRRVLFLVGAAGLFLASVSGFIMSRIFLRPAVRSFDQQQRFVADASHELRTPIATLQLHLEMIKARQDEPVSHRRPWIDGMEREVERLTRLTDHLLLLARADAKRVTAQPMKLNVLELVDEVWNASLLAASAKGLSLEMKPTLDEIYDAHLDGDDVAKAMSAYQIQADPERLEQVLTILLDNAIKYTACGSVRISIERERHGMIIAVSDTGIGIRKEQQPFVFDRFFRADQARSGSASGAGLGLSIAHEIVREHGGRLTMKSEHGVGTTFYVILPLTQRVKNRRKESLRQVIELNQRGRSL